MFEVDDWMNEFVKCSGPTLMDEIDPAKRKWIDEWILGFMDGYMKAWDVVMLNGQMLWKSKGLPLLVGWMWLCQKDFHGWNSTLWWTMMHYNEW